MSDVIRTKELHRDGLDITVEHIADYHAAPDYGFFTDEIPDSYPYIDRQAAALVIECPNCKGKGYIPDARDERGEYIPESDCPDCNGGGGVNQSIRIRDYRRNSYRYYVTDNYRGMDLSEQREYLLQDYRRVEDYNIGYWQYIGIQVIASLRGIELAEDSLWRIESDAKDDIESVESDMVDSVIAEAKENAPEIAHNLESKAAALREYHNERSQ